ncbi:unnamed protein product [Rotaria sp. Silwood1]|nr:unnamed protein product [Rotaria sp. Silwood1]
MKIMFNLPPPPPFTLPPPPIFPSDVFNIKILPQLTCSSTRQQKQEINFHLIIISCIIFFVLSIFLTLLFICIQFYHGKKSLRNNLVSKSISHVPKDIPIYDNCSYETINTSEAILLINSSHIICNQYHRRSSSPPSFYYNISY